jgi:hypothetical protein
MNCPPDVAAILLDLLGRGILHCRVAGWSGDADRCAAIADHVHNLPDLLARYSPDKLRYYWEVERPAFMAVCKSEEFTGWEDIWVRLKPHAEAAAGLVGAR